MTRTNSWPFQPKPVTYVGKAKDLVLVAALSDRVEMPPANGIGLEHEISSEMTPAIEKLDSPST